MVFALDELVLQLGSFDDARVAAQAARRIRSLEQFLAGCAAITSQR
jgi:hypothetical protein